MEKLHRKGLLPVTTEEGRSLARKMNADAYLECSAKTFKGLKDVFDQVIRVVLEPESNIEKKKKKKAKRGSSCVLF